MRVGDAMADLIEQAAVIFDTAPGKITGQDRHREFVWPRHAVCLVARQVFGFSHSQIGHRLGRRDHSTILYAVDNAAGLVESDPTYRDRVRRLQTAAERYKAAVTGDVITTPARHAPAAIGRLTKRLRELYEYEPERFASLKAAILQ